jgi:hypothetical protein
MRFQVQSLDAPDWAIAPDDFAERLVERWSQALVAMLPDSPYAAMFFQLGEDRTDNLNGQYPRSGDGVWIESGTADQVGEFVRWYLELVPPGRRMFLADECVSSVLEVSPGMGAAEIARAFDGEWAAPPWAN